MSALAGSGVFSHNNTRRAAVVALFIACSVWGAAFLFAKLAFAALTVSQVVLYRFTLASLALLPIVLARRVWPRRRDLPLFLVTGFLTVPVTFLLQFGGLALTSATSASLIIGVLPPLLALAAARFTDETLGRRDWGIVIASTLGVLLIIGSPDAHRNWLGDALILASMLTTVTWILLSKRLVEKYSALATSTYTLTFGTLTLLPLSLLWDGLPPLHLSHDVWASVLALGLGCTALTYALWNWGLEHVPASRAGVFLNLEPVVGVLLGVVVLRESLGRPAVIGGTLILVAALLVSRAQVGSERSSSRSSWETSPN
jgi:drug/metabolite transporter (DMT)-like permease